MRVFKVVINVVWQHHILIQLVALAVYRNCHAEMDSQYGIPKKEVEILRQQAAQRAANRQLFLKEVSNPHRHAVGEGGYFFDPAIQRFSSLQPTMYDHFKATPKTAFRGLMYFVAPLSILYYIVWKDIDTREKKIRSGQVAYRDREFKFV